MATSSFLHGSAEAWTQPANSEDATVDFTVGHQLGEKGRVFVRGSFYTEFRNNGTPVQTNDTRMGEGAVGLDQQFGSSDSLTFRAYGLVQGYDQRFSSVAANRNSESLTDLQYVPEQVVEARLSGRIFSANIRR